jgi:DNA-binding beta-propeller fold protein YncE
MEIDEQIGSHLSRTPRDVPAFEPRVDHVLRRATARRLRRRVGAGAVAVLLVAGIGVPLGMLSGLLDPSKPSPAGTPPLVRPVLEARIHIPAGAVDVMVGDGAIWVSGGGKVSRINPLTNEVVATIDTPGTEDYSRVAVGEGGVWVTADGGKLYRIDPATNTVVATIQVGGPLMGVVATGEGNVWVTRPSEGTGELVRIDPATNAVVGEPIEVGPGPVSVVSDLGALWVTNTSPPSVVRVDPVSGEVGEVRRVMGSVPGDLAVAYGSLWAASGDQVVRADPETGQWIETFRIPRAAAVATSEGQVWVLAMPESSSPTLFYPIKGTAALWQIDPADNRIVGEPVRIADLQPIALAAGEGAVWVADYDNGTVTRFDLVQSSAPEGTDPLVIEISPPETRDGAFVNARFHAAYRGTTIPLEAIETPGSELEYPSTVASVPLAAGAPIEVHAEGAQSVAVFELRRAPGEFVRHGSCIVPGVYTSLPDQPGRFAFFIYGEWEGAVGGMAFTADVEEQGVSQDGESSPAPEVDAHLLGLAVCEE